MKTQLFSRVILIFLFVFGMYSVYSQSTIVAHDFNDGNLEPFEECTTKSPNYARVINNRVKTFWTESGYDGGRVSRGTEFCGHELGDWLTYKEGWCGVNVNLGSDYPKNKKAAIVQIMGRNIPASFSTWQSLILIENGDLRINHRAGAGTTNVVEETIYPNFPYQEDVSLIIHFVLSAEQKGELEIWVNGVSSYKASNISFGFGDFENDEQVPGLSRSIFKLGQYNFDSDNYDDNETRTVYYDNVTWYSGSNGYGVVNPNPNISQPVTVNFTPDPNKTYYIDAPYHNLRLAANGDSEDTYTTSINTTGVDVEWRFVDKGNGYWHIQRAAGGLMPRLRTDNSEYADMQSTGNTGTYTYYEITEGYIDSTFFLTLPDGPVEHKRLQINSEGNARFVPTSHNKTWESFSITEASSLDGFSRIEAEDFDAMNGIQTEQSTESGENVGWIHDGDWLRFDDISLTGAESVAMRIACNFDGGTIEIRTGSTTGNLIGSVNVANTGGNQNWETINVALDNASGTQDVYLVFKGGNGYLFNVNWLEFSSSSTSAKSILDVVNEHVTIYPNPLNTITNIQGAKNSTVRIYDISGKLLITKNILLDNEAVDLSGLSPGIYYAQILGAQNTSIVKLNKK